MYDITESSDHLSMIWHLPGERVHLFRPWGEHRACSGNQSKKENHSFLKLLGTVIKHSSRRQSLTVGLVGLVVKNRSGRSRGKQW